MRLIDADSLKESIQRYMSSSWIMPCNEVLKRIDNAPTIEAYPFEQVQELVDLNQQFAQEIENLKRPHGEWIYNPDCVNDEMQADFFCSICNHGAYSRLDSFCPNCGSDMRQEASE